VHADKYTLDFKPFEKFQSSSWQCLLVIVVLLTGHAERDVVITQAMPANETDGWSYLHCKAIQYYNRTTLKQESTISQRKKHPNKCYIVHMHHNITLTFQAN